MRETTASRGPAQRASHALVLDFDGTVSPRDVGHSLFKQFAADRDAWAQLVKRWGRGALGGRDCLEEECRMARAGREEIVSFLEPFALDPAFSALVARTAALGWDLLVMSDGLDFYIAHLLGRSGHEGVPFRANHLEFGRAGALLPSFPHFDDGCGRCGTCKGEEVSRRRSAGQRVWFAGDGISDRCAAPLADRLFARRDLLAFAVAREIPHDPFDSLADILAALPEPGAGADRSARS